MGDGIVNVEEVELVVVDHVHHGAGKSGLIWGVIKERIGRDPHFVVEDVGVEFIEPDWLLIGDEVYLVAFVGQCFSQFCRQYAASAKGWITDNSYTHRLCLCLSSGRVPEGNVNWEEGGRGAATARFLSLT